MVEVVHRILQSVVFLMSEPSIDSSAALSHEQQHPVTATVADHLDANGLVKGSRSTPTTSNSGWVTRGPATRGSPYLPLMAVQADACSDAVVNGGLSNGVKKEVSPVSEAANDDPTTHHVVKVNIEFTSPIPNGASARGISPPTLTSGGTPLNLMPSAGVHLSSEHELSNCPEACSSPAISLISRAVSSSSLTSTVSSDISATVNAETPTSSTTCADAPLHVNSTSSSLHISLQSGVITNMSQQSFASSSSGKPKPEQKNVDIKVAVSTHTSPVGSASEAEDEEDHDDSDPESKDSHSSQSSHSRNSSREKLPPNSHIDIKTLTMQGRKHVCNYCRKLFTRRSNLLAHTRIHTGEKPFHCVFPGCGKRFCQSSNLKRHTKTHVPTKSEALQLASSAASAAALSSFNMLAPSAALASPSSSISSTSMSPEIGQTSFALAATPRASEAQMHATSMSSLSTFQAMKEMAALNSLNMSVPSTARFTSITSNAPPLQPSQLPTAASLQAASAQHLAHQLFMPTSAPMFVPNANSYSSGPLSMPSSAMFQQQLQMALPPQYSQQMLTQAQLPMYRSSPAAAFPLAHQLPLHFDTTPSQLMYAPFANGPDAFMSGLSPYLMHGTSVPTLNSSAMASSPPFIMSSSQGLQAMSSFHPGFVPMQPGPSVLFTTSTTRASGDTIGMSTTSLSRTYPST